MNAELRLILSAIDPEYAETQDVRGAEVNWASVLRTALNNRLLYVFSEKASNLSLVLNREREITFESITRVGNVWMDRFQNTLRVLNEYLGSDGFIAIKTMKYFQDITFDVDILLLSDLLDEIGHLSEEVGFKIHKLVERQSRMGEGWELVPTTEDYLPIDVYEGFFIWGKEIMDRDFVAEGPTSHSAFEMCIDTPRVESELLLYIAHTNFQTRFITLSDFLQITRMISEGEGRIDWGSILSQSEKHNWRRGLVETLSIVSSLYSQVYSKDLRIPGSVNKKPRCHFPYFLTLSDVVRYDSEMLGSSCLRPGFIFGELQFAFFEFLTYRVRNRLPMYPDWINLPGLTTDAQTGSAK